MIAGNKQVPVIFKEEKGEEEEGEGEEEEGEGEEEEVEGEEEEGEGEDEEEGEGQVKCIIAEVKKGIEDAGIQTRAEMYAMLANRVAWVSMCGLSN